MIIRNPLRHRLSVRPSPAWDPRRPVRPGRGLLIVSIASTMAAQWSSLPSPCPSEIARSAGPTYTPESPGTRQISATAGSAAAVSDHHVHAGPGPRSTGLILSEARNGLKLRTPPGRIAWRQPRLPPVRAFHHRDDDGVGNRRRGPGRSVPARRTAAARRSDRDAPRGATGRRRRRRPDSRAASN